MSPSTSTSSCIYPSFERINLFCKWLLNWVDRNRKQKLQQHQTHHQNYLQNNFMLNSSPLTFDAFVSCVHFSIICSHSTNPNTTQPKFNPIAPTLNYSTATRYTLVRLINFPSHLHHTQLLNFNMHHKLQTVLFCWQTIIHCIMKQNKSSSSNNKIKTKQIFKKKKKNECVKFI